MWDLWLEQSKPLVPVIVINDPEDAVPMAKALVAGGVKMLEVTLRTEFGYQAIRDIRAQVPDAIVGVGTVTSAEELQKAVDAGAEFAVSPGFTRNLLDAASEWGGAFLPGVATPGEAMQAREAGFRHLKLFPAVAAGGRDMLRSIGGPLPDLSFCPTGGIGAETFHDYLSLKNVFAVGGSWLTPEKLVSARNWQGIQDLASAMITD